MSDITTNFDFNISEVGDTDVCTDSDLEAELAALTASTGKNVNIRSRNPTADLALSTGLGKILGDNSAYETIENDGVNDDADDNDLDIENDPDLVNELEILVRKENQMKNEQRTAETQVSTSTSTDTISLLQQRLEMYKLAEANAKANEDHAKVRRLNRGLKTLTALLRKANKGENINSDDIPPEVSVASSSAISASGGSNESGQTTLESAQIDEGTSNTSQNVNADVPMNSEQTSHILEKMQSRQQEYKVAALKSKREGDNVMMLEYFKVVKRFDAVIKMCQEGQEVDLSDMPPTPEKYKEFLTALQFKSEDGVDTTSSEPVSENLQTPATILEALQQRLAKYKSVEDAAKANGDASKARRYGRIVKQYEECIKNYKAGRAVRYDELPVPPGFGPLPLENNASTTQTSEGSTSTKTSTPASKTSAITSLPDGLPSSNQSTQRENSARSNLADNQMKILLERQKEFKLAAVQAKKVGDIEQAKEYLKIYKGFDKLVQAARSGLPVDLSSLPVSPNQRKDLEASFAIVSTDDLDTDDMSDIQIRVEEQLAKQLMMCKNTRDHHKEMGDIAGMNRFENLALAVQKDLDLVRYSKRNNYALPKYHYEKRNFNIVHCNTDIPDNEIEIMIVRGFNYNVPNPKSVDTYVRVEFPLLNEQTFKAKSAVVKDTDNPEYNQRFTAEILRSNRQFQRIFKRHSVKFEVYSRGGFLRSDTLLGTVTVKLQPLESKCDIHDTFNLMEGRKPVGGKLEIKLRVRHPILRKQIERLEERWLVLDS